MERLWTEWLYREYDRICFYYRLKLNRPLIQVSELQGKHGSWDGFQRILRISADTIRRYPWDTVLNILKHEMAHQLVDDEGYSGQKPHGPAFLHACRRMGLPDWATRASGELPREIPDWRQSALSEEEQRLLTKVNHLLALAASDNEHEAALAMQRAHEIYARYHLDQVEKQQQDDYVSWIVSSKTRRMEAWQTAVLALLNAHFYVRVIHIKQFDATLCEEFPAAEIMGKRQNVLMAEYVYDFLTKTVHSLWEKYRQSLSVRGAALRRERRTYMIGVLHGFSAQMDVTESRMKSAGRSKALVLSADRALDAFVHTKYPRTTQTSSGGVDTHSPSYQSGQTDGRNIRLHRPISTEQGSQGRLLGAPIGNR